MRDLTCNDLAPHTIVVPILFPKLSPTSDWGYEGEEAANSEPFFSATVTIIAIEMVACVAKVGAENFAKATLSTQILSTGFLNSYLRRQKYFLAKSVNATCSFIHETWGFPPFNGYDFDAWLQRGFIRFKAAQHAHGSTSVATLVPFGRRQRQDAS